MSTLLLFAILSGAFLSGALFGTGLVVSGMTDPDRVIGFLDIFGAFDPRLAFVLGGAVLVSLITFRVVLRMKRPLAVPRFELPQSREIDSPLLAGAATFGVGWGIAGYCPGPALADLGVGSSESLWFVGSMLVGSWIHRWVRSRP